MAPKKGLIKKEIPNLETITIWSVYVSFRVFFSQKDGQKGNLKDLSGMLLDRAQNHSTSIIFVAVCFIPSRWFSSNHSAGIFPLNFQMLLLRLQKILQFHLFHLREMIETFCPHIFFRHGWSNSTNYPLVN